MTGIPEPPIDLSRLTPDERRLWEEHFADQRDGPTISVWGFGYACMLELSGPPEVVTEYLREHDPENQIREYADRMRQAAAERRQR